MQKQEGLKKCQEIINEIKNRNQFHSYAQDKESLGGQKISDVILRYSTSQYPNNFNDFDFQSQKLQHDSQEQKTVIQNQTQNQKQNNNVFQKKQNHQINNLQPTLLDYNISQLNNQKQIFQTTYQSDVNQKPTNTQEEFKLHLMKSCDRFPKKESPQIFKPHYLEQKINHALDDQNQFGLIEPINNDNFAKQSKKSQESNSYFNQSEIYDYSKINQEDFQQDGYYQKQKENYNLINSDTNQRKIVDIIYQIQNKQNNYKVKINSFYQNEPNLQNLLNQRISSEIKQINNQNSISHPSNDLTIIKSFNNDLIKQQQRDTLDQQNYQSHQNKLSNYFAQEQPIIKRISNEQNQLRLNQPPSRSFQFQNKLINNDNHKQQKQAFDKNNNELNKNNPSIDIKQQNYQEYLQNLNKKQENYVHNSNEQIDHSKYDKNNDFNYQTEANSQSILILQNKNKNQNNNKDEKKNDFNQKADFNNKSIQDQQIQQNIAKNEYKNMLYLNYLIHQDQNKDLNSLLANYMDKHDKSPQKDPRQQTYDNLQMDIYSRYMINIKQNSNKNFSNKKNEFNQPIEQIKSQDQKQILDEIKINQNNYQDNPKNQQAIQKLKIFNHKEDALVQSKQKLNNYSQLINKFDQNQTQQIEFNPTQELIDCNYSSPTKNIYQSGLIDFGNNNSDKIQTPYTWGDWQQNLQTSQVMNTDQQIINLKLSDFQIGKKIGSGFYGDIHLVKLKRNNMLFALKSISIQNVFKNNASKYISKEIQIQSIIQHENIVKFYTYFFENQQIHLILEPAMDGHIDTYIKSHSILSESTIKPFISQLMKAISYLHSQGIIHRDIKLENILISFVITLFQGRVKLCDFGYANFNHKDRRSFCGTIDYIAPEIIQNKVYNEKVDVWALGVIIYELLMGSIFSLEIIDNLYEDNREFTLPDTFSLELKDLLRKIFVNQEKRISIKDIQDHLWFSY